MSDVHFREIARDLGERWQELGTYLGFNQTDFDIFKNDHPHNLCNQIFAMLVEWRRKLGMDVEEMKADLVSALKELENELLLNKILEY